MFLEMNYNTGKIFQLSWEESYRLRNSHLAQTTLIIFIFSANQELESLKASIYFKLVKY